MPGPGERSQSPVGDLARRRSRPRKRFLACFACIICSTPITIAGCAGGPNSIARAAEWEDNARKAVSGNNDEPKALELQRPLPDEALKIVASGEKADGSLERAARKRSHNTPGWSPLIAE